MLENWSVTNFKSIQKTVVIKADGTETGKLDLKPLTVFCGANSSGKSSLLQSILLVAQTMRHRDKEFPVVLNGDYTSLGAFDDVKTIGSEGGEIGIGFTYRVESNSIIYRNEYPFNHVWPDEGQPLRKYIPENGFNIDSISSEFLFSHPNSIERTKILPVLSKTVFSVIFYQQKKRYIKDIEKGAYILKWIISESEDKKQYDLEETFIFPDGKMVGIFKEKKPFLPIEVIHNAEFKEKLSGQFSLEKNKTYCVLNHFLPGIINRKINYMYFGFLFFIKLILDTLGYDNNIIQINKAEELHILKDMPASFKILFSECYTVSKKIKEDTEFKARLNKSLQDDKITAFIDLLNGYNKIIDDWKKRGGKDLLDRIRLHQIYYKHIKPLIDGAEIAQYDSLYFIRKHLSRFLSFFSKSIYYLGPLREDPKPLYPYPNNDDSFDLGRKGEHTASVLFLHGARPATDIPLPDQEKTQNNAGDTITVKAAIKQWLAYIGVAGDIEAKLSESGIALKIQTPGSAKWSDLTNVGVGVSQVIPIVVMCLTARKGTTLIFEQPELHLHPKMQTKLAEFFMAIANSGAQCVIETHSEHFINAMRYNIASTPPGKEEIMNKSIIYFVEKEPNSSTSFFREIKINDLGIIPRWPKDFFDEGIKSTDKIILASSKKRAQKLSEEEAEDE